MLFRVLLKSFLIILFISPKLFSNDLPTCVYVSSYHQGYTWSDEIEKSLKNVLKNSCSIIQFDMDTKRNKDIAFIKSQALKAKQLIEKTNPAVVITSDDNVAKYLIKPYFKDSKIPFVFSGINWTAKEYGFPYTNTTGMIEVTPIKDLYKLAKNLSEGKKAVFIGDNTITDKKDLSQFLSYAKKSSVSLDGILVSDVDEWKKVYKNAQSNYDFIILGHNSAIKNWNDNAIINFLYNNSKKLVFTTYSWMMKYSMIGLIIDPKEQGTWAGNTANAILKGFPINQIAMTTNKTWNNTININLLKEANIKLPRELIINSKKYK